MKTTIKTILTSLFLIYISTTYAETNEVDNLRYYDIEIIIFEDTHARYIDSELWRDNSSDDELDNEVEDLENDTTEKTITLFENIPADANKTIFESIEPEILTQQYDRLKGSSQFTVLFHSAWRQAGLTEDEAFEVDLSDLINAHESKSENTITGTAKVVLARYLHFYGQLDYQRQNKAEDSALDGAINEDLTTDTVENNTDNLTTEEGSSTDLVANDETYAIENHRRMRSKELHYIDHPLLGILIQINRAEIEPEKLESDTTKPEEINTVKP